MRTQNHFPTHASGSSDESDRADLAIKTRARTKKPPMYKVLLLNDDYTPMGFVTEVLETVFNKSHAEAMRIMMHVHRKGAGLCGVYTLDVAETKVAQVLQTARAAQYPLQCIMERA